MKGLYSLMLLTVFLAVPSSYCRAQWIRVYQDINAQFYDADFPSDQTGYVAASDTGGAVVLHTSDGGITWDKKYIAGWSFIDKIVMTDSVTGYLIRGGVPGKILKTNNGFASYILHNTDSSFNVKALALVNDSTGFFLNNGARLRKFKHNGSSYSHIIDTLVDGQNLQFVNSHSGYLDTGNGLLMSSDTGITWNFANANLGFFCVAFSFVDSMQGYFSDFSNIYKTNDGGNTFPQQFIFPNAYDLTARGNSCIAVNDTGNIAYTTDGGLTWQTEITGINFLAPEPYEVITTPGGNCFLFSQSCGEIRKRPEPIIAAVSYVSVDYGFSVYPNPSVDGNFVVEMNSMLNHDVKKQYDVSIYDMIGKKISEQIIATPTAQIDLTDYPAGIYFMQVQTPVSAETTKLIVTK
jgi:photosystem II stability/assembly factor-like uncharacterized protein